MPRGVTLDRFARALNGAMDRGASVPLLVVRVPDLGAVLRRRSRRSLSRANDLIAVDGSGERLALALLAPPRAGSAHAVAAIRTTLDRIASVASGSTGGRARGGWCLLAERRRLADLSRVLDDALAQGEREGERRDALATVGHELRTPLTSIRGYIETLLDDELDRATARRFLETARREALRLGRIVEAMLAVSPLDLTASLAGATCDVAEQIRATVDAALPLARERGVTIRAHLPSQARARIDGDACVHALLNLVENGIKHGREGGLVRIACRNAGAFVTVCVDDDGPGIDGAERVKIFDMGVRGGGGGRPGAGIGLAVVKAIAERAGGDVRAGRSPLGGARFVLRLPPSP